MNTRHESRAVAGITGEDVSRKIGDLQVWWVPQVPMPSFDVDVASVAEGVLLLDTLAKYDLFQLKRNVKPDYSNAGGLQRWCADDGEGSPGWEDWYDEETGDDDPGEWLMGRQSRSGQAK